MTKYIIILIFYPLGIDFYCEKMILQTRMEWSGSKYLSEVWSICDICFRGKIKFLIADYCFEWDSNAPVNHAHKTKNMFRVGVG